MGEVAFVTKTRSSFNPRKSARTPLSTVANRVALAAGAVGAAMVCIPAGYWVHGMTVLQPATPDPAGAAIVTTGGIIISAALALVAATSGLETWQSVRDSARLERNRAVYTELARHLMGRFSGARYEAVSETTLRADISTWAGAEVVAALAHWHETFDEIAPTSQRLGDNVYQLGPEEQIRMRNATGAVMAAMRADLGADRVPEELMNRALFNH